eukprot:6207101-Pleurochrysis_carterae.AAC.1
MTKHAFTLLVSCECLFLGICLERPSGAGGEMTISLGYQQSPVRERRRRGGWAHLQGCLWSGVLSGQRRPCASEVCITYGAERERSASTHAMQMPFGKLCM